MPHFPKPFFRKSRRTWYVQINGQQHNLGPDQEDAFRRYYNLMRQPQVRDRRDQAKWHTVQGPLSVTGSQFMNWSQHHGGGGAIDLVRHLAGVDFRAAVAWLERAAAAGSVAVDNQALHTSTARAASQGIRCPEGTSLRMFSSYGLDTKTQNFRGFLRFRIHANLYSGNCRGPTTHRNARSVVAAWGYDPRTCYIATLGRWSRHPLEPGAYVETRPYANRQLTARLL